MSKTISMKKNKRNPKDMGSGIYVHQQFRPEQLVKGDTFFDADFGEMIWDGKKWMSQDDWDKNEWEKLEREWQYHSVHKKINRISFVDYLVKYYHTPKKKS